MRLANKLLTDKAFELLNSDLPAIETGLQPSATRHRPHLRHPHRSRRHHPSFSWKRSHLHLFESSYFRFLSARRSIKHRFMHAISCTTT